MTSSASTEPLTPELVLVSPEDFARWAREQLPRVPEAPLRRPVARVAGPASPRSSHNRFAYSMAACTLVALGALLGTDTGGTPARHVVVTTVEPPAAAQAKEPSPHRLHTVLRRAVPAPRAAAPNATASRRPKPTPSSPVTIRWTPVRGVTQYRVDIARVTRTRSDIVVSFATSSASLPLPSAWYNGSHYGGLPAGRYRWFVWRGGAPMAAHAAGALAQGMLIAVARGGGTTVRVGD